MKPTKVRNKRINIYKGNYHKPIIRLIQIKLDRHTDDNFHLGQIEKLLNEGWRVHERIDDDRYSLYILSMGNADPDVGKTNES